MALRNFRETTNTRIQRDPVFRKALLSEAVNAYLSGDETAGKAILKDIIATTIGFDKLASAIQKPARSVRQMLGPAGNPDTAEFFTILKVLQDKVGVKLRVRAA
jgi:hypothetical protein